MTINALVIGDRDSFHQMKQLAERIPSCELYYQDCSFVPPKHTTAIIYSSPSSKPLSARATYNKAEYVVNPTAAAVYSLLLKQRLLGHGGQWSLDIPNATAVSTHIQGDEVPQGHIHLYDSDTSIQELVEKHYINYSTNKHIHIATSLKEVYRSLLELKVPVSVLKPTITCMKEVLSTMLIEQVSLPSSPPTNTQPRGLTFPHTKKEGISLTTMQRLYRLCQMLGRETITAAELANHFSITLRSARRILTTLETHQLATITGEEQVKERGRPRYVYRLDFSLATQSASSLSKHMIHS
ncbi:hypothetical protein ACFFGV_15005 [Pontibacillus salicampi]|uniref:HTH domain-containing protein n=1 Tax=Pontibacillus salicampi TaxID=1449801 RepID=A0ABV6LR49_9BACI